MEKALSVKDQVFSLLSQNLGERTATSFREYYIDATLPIFLESSLKVLTDLMGKEKAKDQLNHILKFHELEQLS